VSSDRHAWTAELWARRAPLRTADVDRLVLLGTGGGGAPKATRCGYSNAVVVGDAAYLVDCGEGAHSQMQRAGIAATNRIGGSGRPLVSTICLTHLHVDHIVDLVNILQGSWPAHDLDIYGPGPAGPPFTTWDDPVHPVRFSEDPGPGIRRTIDYLHRAFAVNINARVIGERRGDYLDNLHVHEIGLEHELDREAGDVPIAITVDRLAGQFQVPEMEPFVVRPTDANGVTITATLVQHAPVFPALAYRFDTPTGSVVFSGDTGRCDNVVRLARGAELLVHEVIDLDALLGRLNSTLPNYEQIKIQLGRSHTPVGDVAAIAHRAGVGTLVLSHLVPSEAVHTPQEWEALARAGCPEFAGRIVCGVDLDEFALAPGPSHPTPTGVPHG
jgi:ribonuclease BN (tRNA processing enzyme)